MPALITFLFRALLVVAGVVFALSLAVAVAFGLALWLLRAAWSKLTGKPVTPFVMRMRPGEAFGTVYRRADAPSRTPRADAVAPRRRVTADVVDVDPK